MKSWQRSSYCDIGDCVEVVGYPDEVDVVHSLVRVRDSKDPDGPVLSFSPDEWRAFVDGVRAGRCDHLIMGAPLPVAGSRTVSMRSPRS